MAINPDFRQYVDLTINDVQPADIYTAAVEYAALALPEFSPRSGTVEDALLQSMSYVSGVMTGAINRLPDALMQGVLGLMGFTRDAEVYATGAVIFTAIDDTGVAIPAGTRISFTEVTETTTIQHIFQTTAAGIIAAGETTSDPISIIAIEPGEKPVIQDGDSLLLLSAASKLLSATFSGALVQGEQGESDADYFSRGVTYLQSLTSALATKSQIDAYVLTNYREAFRVKTYDLTKVRELQGVRIFESSGLIGASLQVNVNTQVDPIPEPDDVIRIYGLSDSKFNGIFAVDSISSSATAESVIYFTNTIGASTGETLIQNFQVELLHDITYTTADVGGNIVTFVLGADGEEIPQSYRSTIESDVSGRIVAGLGYSVENALLLPITLNITIAVLEGFVSLDVRSAVDTAITDYLSPQSWDWSPIIRRNAIITRISQVPGVDYIDDLTIQLDAGEVLGEINGNGDIEFLLKGVLPSASVTVGAV